MSRPVIPDEAVEAAAERTWLDSEQARRSGDAWAALSELQQTLRRARALRILEAAAPHMLSGVISTLNDQVWRLENTLVDECDYPALCAQREALVGVIQMLGTTA